MQKLNKKSYVASMFLLHIPQKFIIPKICVYIVRPVTIQRASGISSSTSEVGMMTILVLLVVENYEVQRQRGQDRYTFHENICVGSKFVEFKITDVM
jgi:hypothetical protein